MKSTLVIGVVVLGICSLSLAQVTPDEAAKRLAEKQAARESGRSKVVSITQGELDDMRAEIARLKAEVAKSKVSAVPSQATPVKVPTSIAVGMTKDELTKFVSLHKDRYSVLSTSPNPAIPGAPVGETIKISTKAMREVIVGVSGNGVSKFADTQKVLRDDGTMTLTFADGKVSNISEEKLPTGEDEATPDNIKRAVAGVPLKGGRRR